MPPQSREAMLHKAFIWSVIMNGVIGIIDLGTATFFYFSAVIGRILLTYSTTTLGHLGYIITRMVTNYGSSVGAFYFLSHGIVKVFLVWGLITKRLWAYPVSMFLLGIFSLYQIYS